MNVYQVVTILTFVTSTITMICVVVAVLPHVKQGMAVLRDAVLWGTFVLVVAFASWLGWQRVSERFLRPASRQLDTPPSVHTSTAVVTQSVAADPFYRGPTGE